MKKQVVFVTRDGKPHATLKMAKVRAEAAYADALSRLVHKIVSRTHWSDTYDTIDGHLDDFVELKALKDDIELEEYHG